MIRGIGTDLCDMRRIARAIERSEGRFLERSFTPAERAYADTRKGEGRLGILAKRWAAKEAFVKALGTGFRDGIRLTDIEVLQEPSGRPFLSLSGEAATVFQAMAMPGQRVEALLSLSDEAPYALAYVVIQSVPSSS
ncbi:holo-ACP synthase [Swaminathania salitolerans]|uniref:Holo-[acyl-carrier-protein] synthase n=1 Tax=Swaminathania salitolerans TaxID=182838 RepID=A0A511BTX2_9PROT|nr:holo-ACP synthase [Swaminathania salitolerans]GBQ15599.1 holo-ACP synthase [Swaminathania salitolerans LMG 21291]GEL01418.1 holo-[acyl-carrier-protein] synthase [Swaminathania salitolerans]